jgi:hypothetical protein
MKTYLYPKFQILLMMIGLSTVVNTSAQVMVYNDCGQNDRKQYRYSDNFTDYEVQTKGDIKVSDDDTHIISISPGGYLKVSKKTFGNKRSLIIESNVNGVLHYEFYEGRNEIPFEPEGRKWLADILLDVVRITGIDAAGRTERIYSKEGIDGFLDEVGEISSNSISGLYFEALLDNQKLAENELISLCGAIPVELSSNSESGRLFRKYSDLFTGTNTLAVVFFESVSKLSSNAERGSVLRSIKKPLDFNDQRLTEAYFAGIDKLSSNAEAGSVLRYTEKTQNLNNNAYIRLLLSVKKLSSNTEMGSVLRSLSNIDLNDPTASDAWFNALSMMSSNTEMGSVLRHTIKNHILSKHSWINLFLATRKMSSNTEMGSVLRSSVPLMPMDSEILDGFFAVVNSMSSNTEQGLVLRALAGDNRLDKTATLGILKSTRVMTSNTEKGTVLRLVAKTDLVKDEQVKAAYLDAARTLTSDTEYRSVVDALLKE